MQAGKKVLQRPALRRSGQVMPEKHMQMSPEKATVKLLKDRRWLRALHILILHPIASVI